MQDCEDFISPPRESLSEILLFVFTIWVMRARMTRIKKKCCKPTLTLKIKVAYCLNARRAFFLETVSKGRCACATLTRRAQCTRVDKMCDKYVICCLHFIFVIEQFYSYCIYYFIYLVLLLLAVQFCLLQFYSLLDFANPKASLIESLSCARA